jgi:hypothetical protein
MKMKTSILNAITDINLELLSHCSIIFFLLLGFYACSKTGAKNASPQILPRITAKIKEAGSDISATVLLPDAKDLKDENAITQTEE